MRNLPEAIIFHSFLCPFTHYVYQLSDFTYSLAGILIVLPNYLICIFKKFYIFDCVLKS